MKSDKPKQKPPIPNADEVDEASDESFPASDPPSSGQPIHPGPPGAPGAHPDRPKRTPPKRGDRAS